MERKVVLVTGASRGIGRAIALTFAQNGYDVIINCLKSAEALASLEHQILSMGVRCKSFIGDDGLIHFRIIIVAQIPETRDRAERHQYIQYLSHSNKCYCPLS